MGFGSDKTGFYKPSAVTVTASGNPLTLQNAKRLRKLTIYGNAVQDGTPSPDAPVEVQLCGDRTGNLFDVDELTYSGNNGYVESGTIYVKTNPYNSTVTPSQFLEMTGLKEGDTFTCKCNYVRNGEHGDAEYIAFIAKQSGVQNLVMWKYSATTDIFVATIPDGFNGTNYNAMYFYAGGVPPEGETIRGTYSNIAIYKGSYTADTLPAYEPYGYKVSGRAEGLNLLDVSDSANILNGDTVVDGDSITFTTTDFCYGIRFARLTLDPNTEYTLSYQSVNFDGNYTDSYGLRAVIDNSGVPGGASSYITFTTNETGDVTLSYYVGIPYEGEAGKILTIKGVALYKGSYTADTIPPYEPYQPPQDFAVYLPEQIAKVGDVADEVVVDMEKQTAELVRRIERNEFKGTDAWRNDWLPAIVKNLPETAPAIPFARCVSNHFDYNGDTSVPITQIANVVGITISVARANLISGVTDAETFKTWLSDKNVYAYYPLAEPVTTDITSLQQWDAMPQVSGTVTLTLSAEVEPSGAEAVYTASKRPKALAYGAYAVR